MILPDTNYEALMAVAVAPIKGLGLDLQSIVEMGRRVPSKASHLESFSVPGRAFAR